MKNKHFILAFIFTLFIAQLSGQDSVSKSANKLNIEGQFSSLAHFNGSNDLPLWFGGRYIPQLNYSIELQKNRLIDFEYSANIYGNVGLDPFSKFDFDGKIKNYRAWARYSTQQFELRAGLQKINFGSASILRPLMWFDQIDPRDPLRLIASVWGILARYYFFNNANLWLWGLYGNKNLKGWEVASTSKNKPEFGGRFQMPILKGEATLSFHHREATYANSKELFKTINQKRTELASMPALTWL